MQISTDASYRLVHSSRTSSSPTLLYFWLSSSACRTQQQSHLCSLCLAYPVPLCRCLWGKPGPLAMQ